MRTPSRSRFACLASTSVCVMLAACIRSPTQTVDLSLFRYDPRLELAVSSAPAESLAGFTRTVVSYRSPVEGRVPVDLYIPARTESPLPAPAIVFLHGLPGTRASMAPLAAAYARAGVIGLCLSAPFDRDDLSYRKDEARLLPAPLFNTYDQREMIQVVMDVSRAIDLLASDRRVDPKRIAFVGFSYGGAVGAMLAAVEPRLRAVVLMSPSSGLATAMRSWPDGNLVKQVFLDLPKATQATWLAAMDSVEPLRFLMARGATMPIFIQVGKVDEMVARSDVTQLIAAAGRRATVSWYDSGHVLPLSAQLDQARFLGKVLGVALDGFGPAATLFR